MNAKCQNCGSEHFQLHSNRKAQATGLALFMSIVFTVTLVFIFLILVNIKDSAREKEIADKLDAIDADLLLYSLLRTPIDENHNFADYINLYIETDNKKYLDEMEKKSHEILDVFYTKDTFWRLEVNDKKLFKQNGKCEDDIRYAKQTIISFNGKNMIKLYDCEDVFYKI